MRAPLLLGALALATVMHPALSQFVTLGDMCATCSTKATESCNSNCLFGVDKFVNRVKDRGFCDLSCILELATSDTLSTDKAGSTDFTSVINCVMVSCPEMVQSTEFFDQKATDESSGDSSDAGETSANPQCEVCSSELTACTGSPACEAGLTKFQELRKTIGCDPTCLQEILADMPSDASGGLLSLAECMAMNCPEFDSADIVPDSSTDSSPESTDGSKEQESSTTSTSDGAKEGSSDSTGDATTTDKEGSSDTTGDATTTDKEGTAGTDDGAEETSKETGDTSTDGTDKEGSTTTETDDGSKETGDTGTDGGDKTDKEGSSYDTALPSDFPPLSECFDASGLPTSTLLSYLLSKYDPDSSQMAIFVAQLYEMMSSGELSKEGTFTTGTGQSVTFGSPSSSTGAAVTTGGIVAICVATVVVVLGVVKLTNRSKASAATSPRRRDRRVGDGPLLASSRATSSSSILVRPIEPWPEAAEV